MRNTVNKLATAVLVIASVIASVAQSGRKLRAKENKAIAIFKEHKFSEALPLLLSLKEKSKTTDFDYMIGICYIGSAESEKALPYFRSALNSEYKTFVINYYIGRAYMLQGNYIEAVNYLTKYQVELKQVMEATSLKFKKTGLEENEVNKIHNEKTPERVASILSECQTLAIAQSEGVRAANK